MNKEQIISKWERRYDNFLRVADENKEKLEELDMINDWKKYIKIRKTMDTNYYICAIISQFLNDLGKINE